MGTLDDQFGVRKRIVVANMVDVEMGDDKQVYVVGTQAQIRQMLKDISGIIGRGHPWRGIV
jgi:hypothetical protein